ncbi:MAG: transporter [Gammaproteobacteria bacterium]|nr:MAG: transporter [Gammaproteobacteria bacterium]
MRFFCRICAVSFALLISIGCAQADTLRSILQYALVNDPILLEAYADQQAAGSRVGQAKAMHYPTVRLTSTGTVAEHHKNKSDYDDNTIEPTLEVGLNLYSFGAIDAEVKKNEASENFYQHKYAESREELGYTIGDLYLTALNAKESILVLQHSLKRHKAILGDIGTIVTHDRGRKSEYVQAEARKILVEQKINDQKKLLEATLSTLAKYTGKVIAQKNIKDPFINLSRKKLLSHYSLVSHEENPSYLAQLAELESKKYDLEAEKAKRYPSVNLLGTANQDDQKVMVQVSWDLFNRATKFTVKEKENLQNAAGVRLNRITRDVEEQARLAIINMERNRVQLKTLKSQMRANAKVVDFYKLQFSVARKSLIEVLNAESELSDVELAYTDTKNQFNRAVLDYLRSQGKISDWAGIK